MKKRIFSLILCVLVVASMLLTTVFSSFAAETSGEEYTVTLNWEDSVDHGYTSIYLVEGNGSTSSEYDVVTVESGGWVAFEAVPNPYYRFIGWFDESDNLISAALYDEIQITKDYTITPKFEDVSVYGKDHNHDGWTAWSNPSAMPDSEGKYYLTTDVTLSEYWNAPDGIVLCLNGYVLENTASGAAVTVPSDHQVIITDCNSTNQTHSFYQDGVGAWVLDKNNFFENSPYSVEGGVITGLDRCMYVYEYGYLHMLGGHAVGATGSKNGPGVSISDKGVFFMYSGSVQGNVNTNAGKDIEGVKEYDGGGGIFVDVGAKAYLLGDSLIANNTALYTNNGGGVYNYRGTVYFGDSVKIINNRGDNGATSNYQAFKNSSGVTSVGYLYNDLASDAQIGVSVSDGGRFIYDNYGSLDIFESNFFVDDVRNAISAEDFPNDEYKEYWGMTISTTTQSGYVVTAGTRGAGTATVSGNDGAKGVIVSRNQTVTLVATPINDDYSFVGWYNTSGVLLSTNPSYRISRVKSDQHVVAYFTMKELPIEVESSGTIHVFNSGLGSTGSKSYYKNPAFSTYTNNGKYLFFNNGDSYYDQEGPVGVPFYISGKVLEKSIVTMRCYDVDEVYDGYWEPGPERDYVYLVDLTTHTKKQLGYLTGQNGTWTNTSFTLSPEDLIEGHTYQLYLDDSVRGWVAWVDTASISIGAMESSSPVTKVDPITNASLSASINASKNVTGELKVSLPESGIFDIEFKATHIATNNQVGSQFMDNKSIAAPEDIISYSFTLENGAPEGTYRIDAYIKDENGNVLKTVSCTAGYAKVAVTYNANGGTNNLPEDTNAYSAGDTVTVLFDYVPSYVISPAVQAFALESGSSSVVFEGWSTDPDATEPEYTEDGNKTFAIGEEDVTLYAVYHVHTASDEAVIENTVLPNCTVDGSHDEVYYCTDCGEELSRTTVTDPAAGHQYGEWIIDTPATDDTEGSQHKICDVCDDIVTEAIPANGHTYTAEVVAPTCTEQGYTVHTCTNEGCGDSYSTDYVAPLGHTEEIIPGKAPTCTETGLTEGKKCSVCDVTIVEQTVIDALGHSEETTVLPPTCIDNGQIIVTCTVCGETSTEDDDANPASAEYHNYVAIGDKTPSDENDPATGYTVYMCTICGDIIEVPYGYTPDGEPRQEDEKEQGTHTHVYGDTPDDQIKPTCTNTGEDIFVCTECGYIHRVTLPMSEHIYESVVTAPTCTEGGYTTYKCTVCGHTYTDDKTEPAGHTEEVIPGTNATCTSTGLTDGKQCSVCGEVTVEQTIIDILDHTPSDWIVDEEALVKYKECTECGQILETADMYKITVKAEGSGTVSGGGIVDAGESVEINAAAGNHYIFAGWYKDGTLVSDSASFVVENVTESATYTAKFTKQIPVLVDENGDLVLKANGYDVENVKYVYIGTEEKAVKNWNQFMAAKDPESTLMFYTDVADGTAWPQYQTGYYATYIRSTDGFKFYNVVYLESRYSTPYISAEAGDLVMNTGNYTITNVKIAYIGEEFKNVTTWKGLEAAKVEGTEIECYNNVADGTKWPQYTAGYYACYIETAEIGPIYNVVYMENPYQIPYISAEGNALVIHNGGHTVENIKYIYIGNETKTITTWNEFMAAKVSGTALKYANNIADGTSWTVYEAGYYAFYIRTAELGVIYDIAYVEKTYQTPYVSAEGSDLVIHNGGYTVENIKYIYIGSETKNIATWNEFMAAKVSGTKLKYANDVADGSAWTAYEAGYYAFYIRTVELGVIYSVVYMENPYQIPHITVEGLDCIMNTAGYTVENIKYVYIGEETKTINTWDQFMAAKVSGTKLKYANDVADGTVWTQEQTGYYAFYIRTKEMGVIYDIVYVTTSEE